MTALVCTAAAISLTGLDGAAVAVEAAVSQQLPGMAIIGLPDAALAEAKLRVRTATAQSGFPLANRFITVNLSPASLPKHGSSFDLAIALSALAASGHLDGSKLRDTVHIGELGLDGILRRPAGLLSGVIAAQRLGYPRVMVPSDCVAEAALVTGIETIGVESLEHAVAWYRGERLPAAPSAPQNSNRHDAHPGESAETEHRIDMSDVVGQEDAIEALTIAAAGRHHVSMIGPPGAGKTLLAARMPTLLPPLTEDEALEASSIASLGGAPLTNLVRTPPFEHPHHTASRVAVLGGGQGSHVRIGAVTRACHGVLFLDEAPEFSRDVLEGLREPLEDGRIMITRSRMRAELPASVQLLLAANPCPCGNAGSPESDARCQCTPFSRIRYAQRLSGPLMDRIDVRLSLRRVSTVLRETGRGARRTTSRALRDRVIEARARAAHRLKDTPWRVNADVPGDALRGPLLGLPETHTAILDRALNRGSVTMRGYTRALRLAWSIADLAGEPQPGREEIARALDLRGALP